MTIARRLSNKLKTPRQVQTYLRSLPYNRERNGETLSSAETALRRGRLHCFEAAFVAAAILEYHGYPPLVISFDSHDDLDHVIYVYRKKKPLGRGRALRGTRGGCTGVPPGLPLRCATLSGATTVPTSTSRERSKATSWRI